MSNPIVLELKTVLFILAILVALGAIYYFTVAVPAHEEEMRRREKTLSEINRIEMEGRLEEAEIKAEDEAKKRIRDAEFKADEAKKRIRDAEFKAEMQKIEANKRIRDAEFKAEMQKIEDDLKERRRYLDCTETAEKKYWDYVKLNQGKKDDSGGYTAGGYTAGGYTAPTWVWEEARKVRQAAIDGCERYHRLYMEGQQDTGNSQKDRLIGDRALKGQ